MILNINKLQPDNRHELILFATHNFLIYREKHKLVLASCDGERLSEIRAPVDCLNYECLDLGDAILLFFSGKEIIILDKNGLSALSHKLDLVKIGMGISQMFLIAENNIVFGTKQADRVQFVNYNFMENRREAQTSFWKITKITDMIFDKLTNRIYAVLDSSIIVACDMMTGETLWTKFETSKINRGICIHEGELFYSCQGLMKKTDGKNTETISIPLIFPCSLEYNDTNSLYITNNCKSLCKYDVHSKILVWEIFGRHEIINSLKTNNKDGSTLLLLQTEEYIGIVNLTMGRSESYIQTANISKMRITGDHLLIHKTDNTTTLIPGIEEN